MLSTQLFLHVVIRVLDKRKNQVVRQANVFFEPTADFSGDESDGEGEADFQRLPARQLRTRAKVNVRVFQT